MLSIILRDHQANEELEVCEGTSQDLLHIEDILRDHLFIPANTKTDSADVLFIIFIGFCNKAQG